MKTLVDLVHPMSEPSTSDPRRQNKTTVYKVLSAVIYMGFTVAGLAVVALLIVFPMLGTEGGERTLYAMRRPVSVTEGEFRLAIGLFLAAAAGTVAGILAALLRPQR